MKKFSVGLPIAEKAGFVEKIIEYKENIDRFVATIKKVIDNRGELL